MLHKGNVVNRLMEKGEEGDWLSRESGKVACSWLHSKRKPDGNCTLGLCCKECSFLPAGHICRKKKNECDLEELYTEISEECLINTYVQDRTCV